jgi:hypothetical protein
MQQAARGFIVWLKMRLQTRKRRIGVYSERMSQQRLESNDQIFHLVEGKNQVVRTSMAQSKRSIRSSLAAP